MFVCQHLRTAAALYIQSAYTRMFISARVKFSATSVVTRLATYAPDDDGVGLQLRTGPNSGEVIAGEIGWGPFGYDPEVVHLKAAGNPGRRGGC